MFPVRFRKRLMDLAYPAWFMWCASSLLDGHPHNLTTETKQEKIMLKIAIIIGSTRPGRNGEAVAKWVYEIAQKRSDAEFELVDIKDFNLPILDEPVPPSMGQYSNLTPKHGPPRSALLTAMSSSPPSTTMAFPARSRTRLIFCSPSGTTRPPASSATAAPAGRAPSSICVWSWPRCKSRRCATRSCSPCLPTLKTSASSSRARRRNVSQ